MPVTEIISSASISREMLPRDDRRKRRAGASLASVAGSSNSERQVARALVRDVLTLSGEQTAGGVALVSGDVCIRAVESADVDNGVYFVQEGDWERVSTLYDGQVWTVREGDYAETLWIIDVVDDPIEYGTTLIGWVHQLSNVEIASSDETVLIQLNNSNPAAPQFDLSVNPAVGVVASDLSLIVQEVYGESFDIIDNSSRYMREGSRVSIMIDVIFLFPDGDLLGKIIGLPYARIGPEFAATGIVVTPYEHVPGYFTTHHVVVRPDVDDETAIRVYWPTGYFYHPEGEGMVEGNYRLIVEFFYLTDGSEIGSIYVQDFESTDTYIVDTNSADIYQALL